MSTEPGAGHIKRSADIDKSLEELAQHKLIIFGGSYIAWRVERPRDHVENYPLDIWKFTSRHVVALSVIPEENNASTVRICTGLEPPQKFIDSEVPSDINWIEVDNSLVWSRDHPDDADRSKALNNEIPF